VKEEKDSKERERERERKEKDIRGRTHALLRVYIDAEFENFIERNTRARLGGTSGD
jgi:hypothetical protein